MGDGLGPDTTLPDDRVGAFNPDALAVGAGSDFGSDAGRVGTDGVSLGSEADLAVGGSFGPEDVDLGWGAGTPASPSGTAELSCTRMTFPQVLQRMRRIFCLTFSSAME
jgi:hypothetical protein